MRISDWSSDVCSSDLVNFHVYVLLKAWPAAESAPPAGINTSSMTFLLPPAALHVPPQRPTINCAINLWIRCGSLLREILTSRGVAAPDTHIFMSASRSKVPAVSNEDRKSTRLNSSH